MFSVRYIKADPTTHVFQYRKGRLVREGTGLSFFYFVPTTSLVAVPVASIDVPFIFQEVTSDYQTITIQGQVVYHVADPRRLSEMMNFTLDAVRQEYVSEDPVKLPQRIINQVQVLIRNELQNLPLREVLNSSDTLVEKVKGTLKTSSVIEALGVEILDFSILAVKPTPDTSRALEAGVREELLKEADEAIYDRRNACLEQERAVKENELNTEIAVEHKRREIRETQVDAERSVQEKRRLLREEEIATKISLEKKNSELVNLTVENAKVEADAKAYSVSTIMSTIDKIDPKIINALASVGMEPDKLIALSFRELAESAAKIGELNISPDLLRELLKQKRT